MTLVNPAIEKKRSDTARYVQTPFRQWGPRNGEPHYEIGAAHTVAINAWRLLS